MKPRSELGEVFSFLSHTAALKTTPGEYRISITKASCGYKSVKTKTLVVPAPQSFNNPEFCAASGLSADQTAIFLHYFEGMKILLD